MTWEVKKLGDVCEILNGGTPKTSIKEYWDGNILWITPKDLGKLTTKYVDKTPRTITELGLNKSSAKIIPYKSLILSTRAPIGYLAINKKEMATNQGCRGIIPHKNINVLFLYYFLSKSIDLLNKLGNGATFKELSTSSLASINILLPPLPEQLRIIAILDSAFENIARAKESAEQNLKNANEIFESYLQSVFENKGEGWEEKKLIDICNLVNGRAYNKKELLKTGKYTVLRVGNFFTNKHWYYSDLELPDDKYCDKGDLLYAWSASFGPRIWEGDKVIYHYHIWKVIPNLNLVSKEFLFILLDWDKEKIKAAQGTGTTMMHVSKGSMEERIMPLPNLREQQSIVSKLNTLSAETKKLEAIYTQKLADLEELKKSILQKAFNGELK